MLTKTLIVGASLAMLASAAMASPASERAEREATRALNRAQAQVGRAAEDQAEAKAVAQVKDVSKPGAPPAAAPTMLIQVAAAAPVDTPNDPAMNAQAAPTPADAMAPADTSAATSQSGPLASLRNLPARMATASVADSSGRIVGAVQRVETSPDGRAVKVDVALLGKKLHIVSLDAASLSYDAQTNRITAEATVDALKALPNKS